MTTVSITLVKYREMYPALKHCSDDPTMALQLLLANGTCIRL